MKGNRKVEHCSLITGQFTQYLQRLTRERTDRKIREAQDVLSRTAGWEPPPPHQGN